ncbi:hypothetical protein B0H63DRAFT_182356 [Podospora didyma]|uniref:Uncharacterized protein n=1 Tax=Podospora didyma TaxID=330526 RepID=A0AAE0TZN5_9PEZI|nr:hypothetical protein B0H63DRAFT_182356 [Podospora didyma]
MAAWASGDGRGCTTKSRLIQKFVLAPFSCRSQQAPSHFEVPEKPLPAVDSARLDDEVPEGFPHIASTLHDFCPTNKRHGLQAGRPVLDWQRPLRPEWDKNRILLATGRYADEKIEREPIAVPDWSQGFPQSPTRATRSTLRIPPFTAATKKRQETLRRERQEREKKKELVEEKFERTRLELSRLEKLLPDFGLRSSDWVTGEPSSNTSQPIDGEAHA